MAQKVIDSSGIINARDRELEGKFLAPPSIEPELKEVGDGHRAACHFAAPFPIPIEKAVETVRIALDSDAQAALEQGVSEAEILGDQAGSEAE